MEADELSLATRAAWLSYVGNQTQEEIAGRLGVSRIKVNRLIGQARRAGPGARVRRRHRRRVHRARGRRSPAAGASSSAPWRRAADDGPLPLATLAAAGGHWLHRVLEAGRVSLIGVGHGRTLAAVVDSLPRMPRPSVRFVSLLGSLTRHAAANPFDVIHRLAEITGGRELLHAGAVLRRQHRGQGRCCWASAACEAVFALARAGRAGRGRHRRGRRRSRTCCTSGMITRRRVRRGRAGRVRSARCSGRFVDARRPPGRRRRSTSGRSRSGSRTCAGRQVVAIAGGRDKAARDRGRARRAGWSPG